MLNDLFCDIIHNEGVLLGKPYLHEQLSFLFSEDWATTVIGTWLFAGGRDGGKEGDINVCNFAMLNTCTPLFVDTNNPACDNLHTTSSLEVR